MGIERLRASADLHLAMMRDQITILANVVEQMDQAAEVPDSMIAVTRKAVHEVLWSIVMLESAVRPPGEKVRTV